MYLHGGIAPRQTFNESAPLLLITGVWSTLVVVMHDLLGMRYIAIPALPVTTIGIVISLYLGFKSSSAYDRWWEARQMWGELVNKSRSWTNMVLSFVAPNDPSFDADRERLVRRHIGYIVALAYALRARSQHQVAEKPKVFGYRPAQTRAHFTAKPEDWESWFGDTELDRIKGRTTVPAQILKLQGEDVAALFARGAFGENRFVELVRTLSEIYDWQGKCERVKNTPFPVQFTYFGRLFTYVFLGLLPLAFVDSFEAEVSLLELSGLTEHLYLFMLVPFSMLVSWVFYVLERVSESCEDPFEWGATDVPVASLARLIEVDLLEMLGENEVPARVSPVAGIQF